ncbi:MAG: preprotein translocase subunit YajC [Brevundimonas sp.]|jgi:preprotein translocase subunit YajC|uniref:preprotein translocase subunit YajC n=1 Tax=Brevundimonas sp. TaxID=1871086 RepID=UPI0039E461BA
MFATPAYASTAGAAAAGGGLTATLIQFLPFVLIFVLFWFLLIRPQQKRMKAHQAMVAGVKRGDTVVLSNGMIGKVTRVEDQEAMVEISQGVNVRVVKTMIAEVRNRTEIAANDKK